MALFWNSKGQFWLFDVVQIGPRSVAPFPLLAYSGVEMCPSGGPSDLGESSARSWTLRRGSARGPQEQRIERERGRWGWGASRKLGKKASIRAGISDMGMGPN